MPEVCLVIPCFNEELRFRRKAFSAYLAGRHDRYFVFVNDGSTDATGEILHRLEQEYPARVNLIELPVNMGKSAAVRYGVLEAVKWKSFDLVGYLDADLSTPLEEIDRAAEVLSREPGTMLILGSRSHKDAGRIERSWLMARAGSLFALICSWMLGIRIYDTQCGFKIFTADLTDTMFSRPFVSKWIFDVEILRRIVRKYGRTSGRRIIQEFPLQEWVQMKGSRISIGKKLGSGFDLLKFFIITE